MARIVLVTGAAGGIGRRLVYRFASLGDTVLGLDVTEPGLDQVATEWTGLAGAVHKIVADLTNAVSLSHTLNEAIETHGMVDVLIANAGGASAAMVRQTTIESWHDDIDLNLNGTMHTVQAILPGMISKRKGNIVAIGSVNAMLALGPAFICETASATLPGRP